jgi:hypothetical protein
MSRWLRYSDRLLCSSLSVLALLLALPVPMAGATPALRLELKPSAFVAGLAGLNGGAPESNVLSLTGSLMVLGLSTELYAGVSRPAEREGRRWKKLKTRYGLPVARLGYGLYLGKVSAPRAKLFFFGQYEPPSIAERRGRSKLPGSKLGLEGTLLLTRSLGLHFDVKGGGPGWYGGLTLLYVPL